VVINEEEFNLAYNMYLFTPTEHEIKAELRVRREIPY